MKATLADVLHSKDSKLVTASPEEPVLTAVRRMTAAGVGSVLALTEAEHLAGILTERDVLVRIVAMQRDPADTAVAEVMTRPVVTVRRGTSVAKALQLCAQHGFRRLPVVQSGKVEGLLTLGDLTRWLVDDQQNRIAELNDYIWGPYGVPGGNSQRSR